MKKKDLKNGMIIEFRNGRMALVIKSQQFTKFLTAHGHMCEDEYDENLTFPTSSAWDVMSIYMPTKDCIALDQIFNKEYLTNIWTRSHVKRISKKEIRKMFKLNKTDILEIVE